MLFASPSYIPSELGRIRILRAAGARTKQAGNRPIWVRFCKRVLFVHRSPAKWPGAEGTWSKSDLAAHPSLGGHPPRRRRAPRCRRRRHLAAAPQARRRRRIMLTSSPLPSDPDIVAAARNTTPDYFVLSVQSVTATASPTMSPAVDLTDAPHAPSPLPPGTPPPPTVPPEPGPRCRRPPPF